MRAIRYHAFGPPADVLQVDDVPTPAPGAGEVRVRVTHRSLNPADLHTVHGGYGTLPSLPAVAGHEGTGTVEVLGDGVRGVRVGQRVVLLGAKGTWQESVVLPASDLYPVPNALADADAAQLFVNPLTAWRMLEELGLSAGDWLLQTGATTQVGRLVIQFARRRGIRTVNLVRRASARPELEALGADAVIVATGESDGDAVRGEIRAITDGGAHGAVDAVAGTVGSLAASTLRDQATMLVYGGLSKQPLMLGAPTFIFQRVVVRGFWRTRWFELAPRADVLNALDRLATLLADGALVLPVDAAYDLGDISAALGHARTPGRTGKILLIG